VIDFHSHTLTLKGLAESGEFAGYGSVFDNVDDDLDVIAPGAFKNTLQTWSKKGKLPPMLWQHDRREPIGYYSKMEEDQKGLYVEGRLLVESDPMAQRAHAHLRAGTVSGLSVGFRISDSHVDERGVRKITDLQLYEVSLVTFPANESAQVESVKHALESPRNLERFLRDTGLTRSQAKGITAAGFKALNRCDDEEEALQQLLKTLRNS